MYMGRRHSLVGTIPTGVNNKPIDELIHELMISRLVNQLVNESAID